MRASLFQNWKHLKDVTGDTTQWVGVCCSCRVAEFSFQHLHGTVHSHLEHRLKVSDTVSQQTSCPLDLTIFLPPLCWYSLNLRCTSCIVDVTFGMYYKKLYFSIMASICCKEKLLFLPIVFPSSNSSDVGIQHGVTTEASKVKRDHRGKLKRGKAGYRWCEEGNGKYGEWALVGKWGGRSAQKDLPSWEEKEVKLKKLINPQGIILS